MEKQGQKLKSTNTNRISKRIIRIHLKSKFGIKLGAPVHRTGSCTMLDDGNDIKWDSAHVEQHAGDVDERRKEEHALAAK